MTRFALLTSLSFNILFALTFSRFNITFRPKLNSRNNKTIAGQIKVHKSTRIHQKVIMKMKSIKGITYLLFKLPSIKQLQG